MNINYENNNLLTIKGKVLSVPTFSHSVLGEGFFETKIEVKRLSSESDILPITISDRLVDSIKVDDIIAIKGQFRSYNKLEDNHSKLMLTVFVREILQPESVEFSNEIKLIGYVCKEPIYRTTPFGREIADILLAVNRAYNKSDYLPCIAWGRNARYVKNMQIGQRLEINGRVQSRVYQKKIDDKVLNKIAYEVSISSVIAVESDIEAQRENGGVDSLVIHYNQNNYNEVAQL